MFAIGLPGYEDVIDIDAYIGNPLQNTLNRPFKMAGAEDIQNGNRLYWYSHSLLYIWPNS